MFPWNLIRRSGPAVGWTAALEPMYTDGTPGTGVGLTGVPRFLGAETDGKGVRYARILIGLGPDAHVVIRTPDAGFCTALAGAGVGAFDALNPVPAEMAVTS